MNVRVLPSISQNSSTVSMNASKQLPLQVGINRSYSHIYLAEAYNHDVATTIKPLVDKSRNVLTVKCPPDIGTVYTDVTKIYQCFLNLLSNASKFTEAGEITLEVSRFRRRKREAASRKKNLAFRERRK
ncbi:sensor histidine kinase [Microcoleus sp.]|uniref:sensor histidine kinase n=1 Tax=Microcoleus sp. TaxID=44472 RepID=UPI00403E4684